MEPPLSPPTLSPTAHLQWLPCPVALTSSSPYYSSLISSFLLRMVSTLDPLAQFPWPLLDSSYLHPFLLHKLEAKACSPYHDSSWEYTFQPRWWPYSPNATSVRNPHTGKVFHKYLLNSVTDTHLCFQSFLLYLITTFSSLKHESYSPLC